MKYSEKDPEVIYIPNIKDSTQSAEVNSKIEESGKLIVHTPYFDIDKFRKQNVYYESLNGINVKYIIPRKIGIGITGIYIDSIIATPRGNLSFHIYGNKINPKNQNEFEQIFKSFYFHENIKKL